jgi:hypothetical protein
MLAVLAVAEGDLARAKRARIRRIFAISLAS